MADPHDEAHGHEEHHGKVGHLVPARYLIVNCVGLLILTLLTVSAAKVDFASYGLPDLNIIIALTIAVIKASLVCLFFMHLFWDRPFHAFVIVAALAFVGIMISFSLTDTFEYRPQQEQYRLTKLKGGDSLAVQQQITEVEAKADAASEAPK